MSAGTICTGRWKEDLLPRMHIDALREGKESRHLSHPIHHGWVGMLSPLSNHVRKAFVESCCMSLVVKKSNRRGEHATFLFVNIFSLDCITKKSHCFDRNISRIRKHYDILYSITYQQIRIELEYCVDLKRTCTCSSCTRCKP